MTQTNLFYPLLIQVLLTFFLLFRMAFLRFKALKNKNVIIKDIALGQDAWTENATKAERSFDSQFEMPVLFYAAVFSGIFLPLDSNLFLILSWVFVITRLLHAFIHSTSNYVPHRFRFFLAGVLTLLAMWIVIAIKVI
jgi:hypothetical protein